MPKKFLIILSIAVFSLIFSGSNFCLAVPAPTSPDYKIVERTYDYIAIEFSWDRVNGEVAWYHLAYWCVENCSGGSATWVIQPTEAERVSKLYTGGFEFSLPTVTKKYKWQVGACSSQAEGACVYFQPPQEFTTPLQPPPPNPCQSPNQCKTSCPEGWQETGGECPPGQVCCQQKGVDKGRPELVSPIAALTLEELFNALINFLFYLAMSVGPIMIIYAAFLILTAGGKAEQVNKGKTIILWTLIAVAIVLLAKGLPSVVKGILGG